MGQALYSELFGEWSSPDDWSDAGSASLSSKAMDAYDAFVMGEQDFTDKELPSSEPDCLPRFIRTPRSKPYVKTEKYNDDASLILYRLCQHCRVRVDQIETMLNLGADPNFIMHREKLTNSLLHLLVRKSNFEGVEYLLRMGAKSNITNAFNQTPLIVACDTVRGGDAVRIVRLLLEQKNPKIESRDTGGASALMSAVFKSNPWICRY